MTERYRYFVGYRSPRYVVHREGEDRPVHYADSKVECQEWIITQMCMEFILNEMDSWDDEILDFVETMLLDVLKLDPTTADIEDPNGSWMKSEDYVLALIPAALRRAADELEEQFRLRNIKPEPPNPAVPKIHAV